MNIKRTKYSVVVVLLACCGIAALTSCSNYNNTYTANYYKPKFYYKTVNKYYSPPPGYVYCTEFPYYHCTNRYYSYYNFDYVSVY